MPTKPIFRRILTAFIGIAIAVLFTLPYFLLRNQIQEYATLGYVGLFFSCAISNSSVLIPSSSTLLVMSSASILNPWICILVGGIGSALGEQVSYLYGRLGRKTIHPADSKSQRIMYWMRNHSLISVFLFAFLPLPLFDIVGVSAGIIKMDWWKYTLAVVSGKILKFAFILYAIVLFVPWFIENYPQYGEFLQQKLQILGVKFA